MILDRTGRIRFTMEGLQPSDFGWWCTFRIGGVTLHVWSWGGTNHVPIGATRHVSALCCAMLPFEFWPRPSPASSMKEVYRIRHHGFELQLMFKSHFVLVALQFLVRLKHGDPAADQIVRGPSGGCRGDLISTPDSGYYGVFYKSFLWGNLRFGGCFEKPSLQALFWCKNLRSRKKIGKVTKRRRSAKPTCANGGTNCANGGTNCANGGANASFCTSGDFQFFLARGQVCFEFDSATVKREKKERLKENKDCGQRQREKIS